MTKGLIAMRHGWVRVLVAQYLEQEGVPVQNRDAQIAEWIGILFGDAADLDRAQEKLGLAPGSDSYNVDADVIVTRPQSRYDSGSVYQCIRYELGPSYTPHMSSDAFFAEHGFHMDAERRSEQMILRTCAPLFKEFAATINRELVVHMAGWHCRSIVTDRKFHLYLGSSPLVPGHRRANHHVTRMFGHHVPSQHIWGPAQGIQARVLNDVEDEVSYAQHWRGDHLYCFWRPMNGTSDEQRALKDLLTDAAATVLMGDEDFATHLNARREKWQEGTRNRFIQVSTAFLNGSLERVQQSKRAAEERAEEALRTYQEAIGEKRRLDEEEALISSVDSQKETFGEQFDRLLENASVKEVSVKGGHIFVHTHELVARDENSNTWRHLGELSFRITPGNNSGLTVRNMTYGNRFRRPAPHVDTGDGHVCFGGSADAAYAAFRDPNVSVIVDFLVAFFERPNINDDWGRIVSEFPKAPRALLRRLRLNS